MSDLDEESNKVFRMPPPKKITKGLFITDLDDRLRTARQEQMENDRRAMCQWCAAGRPVNKGHKDKFQDPDKYYHSIFTPCAASPIREANEEGKL